MAIVIYTQVHLPHGPSVEASKDTEVESRTTRKRRNSRNGEFCVARQRPGRRFATRLPGGAV